MSKMPWVRFFPSDWLGGTRGMSAVETGIYITLIATMYERGEPIVEDHSRLARLCGASNSAFRKALETLLDEGKIVRTDAGLWNDRVEKEQVYFSEKSEVGSRAANARWNKKDKENNGSNNADALPSQSPGNANQKPDTRIISSSLRSEDTPARSIAHVVDAYSEMARSTGLSVPREINKSRKAGIEARVRESGMPAVLEAIQKLGASSFCHGSNDRGWRADLDFLIQPKSFAGLLEGKYDDRPRGQPPPRQQSITDVLKQQVLEMQENERRQAEESDGDGEEDGTWPPVLRLASPSG